jgi:diguanylate cyclase (GGDEF)-like protein
MKKQIFFISLCAWWLLLGLSFWWNLSVQRRHTRQLALDTARAFHEQIVTTRDWNATHGGVYVRQSEQTPPNPYLTDPDRDLVTTKGFALTLINPAYMTRQIAEIAEQKKDVLFHITSLKPIRPLNKPEPWEAVWLASFEKGSREQSGFFQDNEITRFRYMAPLITQESCLVCHRQQGYRVGDVRGGISITLPFIGHQSGVGLLVWHLLLALVGAGAFFFMGQKLVNAYEIIRRQATIDALTGVPNRRFFTERLIDEHRRSWRTHQPLSLIMCDIDEFKRYNDHYGHVEGDHCLVKVAAALGDSITRSHDLCARYGGEEFVVLLPSTDSNGARIVAERIVEKVRGLQIPHQASSVAPFVTISVGAYTDANGTMAHEDLIKQADMALYQAKGEGKNRVRCLCVQLPEENLEGI